MSTTNTEDSMRKGKPLTEEELAAQSKEIAPAVTHSIYSDSVFCKWVEEELGIDLKKREVMKIEIVLEAGLIPYVQITEHMKNESVITMMPLGLK